MDRYALYYAPQSNTPLAQAASKWFGRDANNLQLQQTVPLGIEPKRFFELTRAPYHYGFHGTLKPPFRINGNGSSKRLIESLDRFCRNRKPFFIQSMEVSWLGNFLCLRPSGHCEEVNNLASDAVQVFDHLRTPMTELELERRRGDGLTAVQESLLKTWGYPYVFEEFHFHLTLTSSIEKEDEAQQIEKAAKRHFRQTFLQDIELPGISLFVEKNGKPMTLHQYFPFTG